MAKQNRQSGVLTKNSDIELVIDSLGSEGQGIGRYEGMAVFVPFALAGERVKVHIIKVAKNYAVGKLTEITEPSPLRREPRCAAFTRCGGCALLHMDYAAQLEHKRSVVENALKRIGKVENPVVLPTIGMEHPYNYRNKAAFPFGVVENRLCYGYYAPRSHRIVPIEDCLIEQKPLLELAQAVHCWAEENCIAPYDEETKQGTLRHVVGRITIAGELMAVMVCAKRPKKLAELTAMLQARCQNLCSVILNINSSDTNVILGSEYETLWGESTVKEELCGFKFNISAASFLQVNSIQAEKLYGQVESFLPEKDGFRAVDVYCGTGTITLMLSRRASHVTGIENVPPAVEDARRNAANNGVANTDFICDDAAVALPALVERGERPDVIVIDPPRKGADRSVINAIIQSGAPRLIYVSCDPATLARDVQLLCEGGFTLQKAQPVDMFPQTGHVETVVLLSQQKPDDIVRVSLDLSELDITAAEQKASYGEIKEYVLAQTGLNVSSLYIAQVKQKYGIIERENYNKPKNEDTKQPQCPPEKEKAIMEALKHFKMITE